MFRNAKWNLNLFLAATTLLGLTAHALPSNMHLIDSDQKTGFEIYRSSTPSTDDVREWCTMGITEVFVLSGDAEKHELVDPTACPGLKIVYNTAQRAGTPVTTEFLTQFDAWVKDAQTSGKKILFRCNCGCHRTGRLAAYYRMKYNGWSSSDAIAEMKALGHWMFFFPFLKPQVRAMDDFINGRECSQKWKHCVIDSSLAEDLSSPAEDDEEQMDVDFNASPDTVSAL